MRRFTGVDTAEFSIAPPVYRSFGTRSSASVRASASNACAFIWDSMEADRAAARVAQLAQRDGGGDADGLRVVSLDGVGEELKHLGPLQLAQKDRRLRAHLLRGVLAERVSQLGDPVLCARDLWRRERGHG